VAEVAGSVAIKFHPDATVEGTGTLIDMSGGRVDGPDGLTQYRLAIADGWMRYGCEVRSVHDWLERMDEICARHAGDNGPVYAAWLRERVAEARR